MDFLLCEGCKVYFHPVFLKQYEELVSNVKKQASRLDSNELTQHKDFKMLKSLRKLIKEVIPADPFASYFRLKDDLVKYKRVKRLGLPNRHRLFFKPLIINDEKVIVILWLGYPRKEGDKNDCYKTFTKMVANGYFPENSQELLEASVPVEAL